MYTHKYTHIHTHKPTVYCINTDTSLLLHLNSTYEINKPYLQLCGTSVISQTDVSKSTNMFIPEIKLVCTH